MTGTHFLNLSCRTQSMATKSVTPTPAKRARMSLLTRVLGMQAISFFLDTLSRSSYTSGRLVFRTSKRLT